MRTNEQIKILLKELLALPRETEWLEFKQAKTRFEVDKLGKYFSAISNEANLKGRSEGWIVFGIEDSDHSVVGTSFRNDNKHLHDLKGEISQHTTYGTGFREIYETKINGKRVILFEIPAALRGIPAEWKGQFWAREGDNLVPLSEEKRERIRNQHVEEDWSKQICEHARLDDLDSDALELAKENYLVKHPDKRREVGRWNDTTFLNKAKLTIKGKITRTALILLGKPESAHLLDPADVAVRWVLKNASKTEIDYEIFGPPLLLAVDKIYSRIRNVRYRYFKQESLFPDEVLRYEPFVIREAINNCIAHQDYSLGGRINVIEMEDQLVFSNLGSFIPGSIEKVILDDAPEEKYRNRFLAGAMVNLNMVDTIGSGIRKMFEYQRARFFPLPDFELSGSAKRQVKVTIIGKVPDMDYAEVLAQDPNLGLTDILMLDKVQKGNRLSKKEAEHLKSKGLIEGKKPNFVISANLAKRIGQKSEYTKRKGLTKEAYFILIKDFLKQHGSAERRDIDEILWDHLPNYMSEKQKKTKVNHLLTELSTKRKEISNTGSFTKSNWVLNDDAD